MKNWLSTRSALALALAASFLALAQPARAEKRALVIGNNDYKNVPKLQKAVNDARTMGDTLKQLGFSVMVAENQTRQAFSETLLAFDKAVEAGDTAFFFYAGHGFEIAGQNLSGELQGPFPIKFDPEAALIHDQRKILDMTATSWLAFREFNGLLVYYTHLMSYRCAIREVRIGIDSAVPDKVLKMPPCDPRDPFEIPHDAQPYLKVAPVTQFVSVELTYRDGSVSEIKSFRKSSGLIP
jgi:hypothetical protein